MREDCVKFSIKGLPDWQLQIIRTFPDIYIEPNPEITQLYAGREHLLDRSDYCNLRFGFEFDSGWEKLVTDFSRTASDFVVNLRESGLQPDAWIRSCVFKEKYGSLVWQGCDNLREPYRTLVHGYTQSVEQRALLICEVSGKSGTLRKVRGWWRVLSEAEYVKAMGAPSRP